MLTKEVEKVLGTPPPFSSEVADCKTYTAEVSMRPTAAKVTQVYEQ